MANKNDNKINNDDASIKDLENALKLESFNESQKVDKNKNFIISILAGMLIVLLIFFAIAIIFSSIQNSMKKNLKVSISEPSIINMDSKVDSNIIDQPDMVLDREHAKIDIIWIDKDNNQLDRPLKPVLRGMRPVKYDSNNVRFVETNEKDGEWYDYNNKIWANALNSDNSYFVWIPRFAYKIVYYTDATCTKISGYSDSRGILKVSDNDVNTFFRVAEPSKGIVEVGNHYILHPAFMNDRQNDYINGGNDVETSGFWMSKYEVSLETKEIQLIVNSTDVLANDKIFVSSKPCLKSWRNISIKNAFINAYNYDRNKDSHMTKASEWGAVTYLAFSKYGTEGINVFINDNENFCTGGADREEDVYKVRFVQSSNRNPTGVYDLSGGVSEYIAAFVGNNSPNLFINGGNAITDIGGEKFNSRYRTVYNVYNTDNANEASENPNSIVNNYYMNSSKRGDSLWETSNIGALNSGWFYNASVFPVGTKPFFKRGGCIKDGIRAGLFNYEGTTGKGSNTEGYRVVLSVNI